LFFERQQAGTQRVLVEEISHGWARPTIKGTRILV